MLTEKTAVERVMDKRRALGRGLESLLPRAVAEPGVVDIQAQAARQAGQEVLQLKLDEIVQNPYQTRLRLDQNYLAELAASIRTHGVLQPVTVRPPKNGKYALIAGECRWKASSMAGKETIPAIVRAVSDQQSLELTIIENLQRQDLNCLEQAMALERLSREFQLTQEEIALKTGMERSTVGNYLRLMRLPESVQELLAQDKLSFGQIKTIMRLEERELISRVALKTAEEGTSIRELEEIVFNLSVLAAGGREPGQKRYIDPNVRQAQTDLERALGVKVKIRDTKGRGSILLQYRNLEDFDRVVGMLKGKG
jgi:ParB family chromosome partitioning protein